jgi:hypothetical protein
MARLPRPYWLNRLSPFHTRPRRTAVTNRQRSRPNLEALEARWVPSTVTNLNNAGPGSLRQAILDTPAGGTVDFQPGLTGTITLTSGELDVLQDLTITGPGADVMTVSGNQSSRVFNVAAGVTAAISGLTIADGRTSTADSDGGGIANAGTLTLSDSTLRHNAAVSDTRGGNGGGVANASTLTILGCIFDGNTATDTSTRDYGGMGGGIYNQGAGTLTIRDTVFNGNSTHANLGSSGGGIENDNGGAVTITHSTLSGSSVDGGGGIETDGQGSPLTLTECLFVDNVAFDGGGISNNNSGPLTIAFSTFRSNRATNNIGGAIENSVHSRSTLVDSSSFTTNFAGGNGGGIYNEAGNTLTIMSCTFAGNSTAGYSGGIENRATLTVINSTFNGNAAQDDGGAIGARGGTALVSNSTISGNSAHFGSGILSSSTLTLRDDIVSLNQAMIGPDVYGTVTTQDHDLITSDPMLGPLQDNGGPTFTMALLPSSPAIGAGTLTNAPEWDQRGPGYPRVVNGLIDIGAFEHQPAAPTVTCSVADSLLWPPNHRLVNVGLSVTVDPPDADLQVLVYANDNANPSDAADIGPDTLQLRAERQGNGNGRVYLVVVTATNAGGTSFDVCTVAVPHDQSPRSIASVQQQAATAEAYYREFQTAPPGYDLLGEGPDGGGDAPSSGQSARSAIPGDTFRIVSPIPATSPTPPGPASVKAASFRPADEMLGARAAMPVDGYFATAYDRGFRFLETRPAPADQDAITGAALDLLPGDDRLMV